jgi:phosphoglycerate dehydrogenase-like enzyme
MRKVLFLHDLGIRREETTVMLQQAAGDHDAVWYSDGQAREHGPNIEMLVTSDHVVDATTVDAWPNLKMISLAFTGYDRVDLARCAARGLHVYFVPGYSTDSVAELAIGLTMALFRKIVRGDANVRSGRWDAGGVRPGIELTGKTVGIIGTGTIGLRSARKFRGLDCRVIGWNRTRRGEFLDLGCEYRDRIEDVFREADVIVLHLAARPETRRIVNARLLGLMKPTSVLLNVARAELVDTPALVDALRNGRIRGAAVDVFDEEPPSATAELLAMENVVLTPHLGFKTQEALRRLAEETIANIGRYLAGDPTNRLLPPRPLGISADADRSA